MVRRAWLLAVIVGLVAPGMSGCGTEEASAYTAAEQKSIAEADAKREAGIPVWCKVRKQGWIDGEPADCPACVQEALKELAKTNAEAKAASKAAEEARGPRCECESCKSGQTDAETHKHKDEPDASGVDE